MPKRNTLNAAAWQELLARALAEDIGAGDVTGNAVFAESARAAAVIEARQPLVLAGLEVARAAFKQCDPQCTFEARANDGMRLAAGAVVARVSGRTRALLCAERTALNFLARLCGVATFTRKFVEAVAGTEARIVDTRKTTPGWRALEKYAVAAGGGTNHRFGLYDAVLIKDNHIAAAGGVSAAVNAVRKNIAPGFPLQVEVESMAGARAAIAAGATSLLLDNQTPAQLREYVAAFGGALPLEASGGITLANVRAVAETGVARISIGALTHSAPAADLALEME